MIPPFHVAFGLALAAGADPTPLIGDPPGDTRLDRATIAGTKPLAVVVDSPYQIWSGLGTLVHVAVYRPPGFAPVRGARVYLDDREVGRTGAAGTVVFRNVPRAGLEDERDLVLRRAQEGRHAVTAVLDADGETFAGTVEFNTYARTGSFESAHIFVYTDRGVYNPGQPVLVRLIAWRLRGDFAPIADKSVELHLKDDRGRLVGGGKVRTDDFGVASLRLPLPEEMPEGRYELVALVDSASASAPIRVERFVPPVFDVRHTLRRYVTSAERGLGFEVTPSAFVGGPLTAGTIAVRVASERREIHRADCALGPAARCAFEVPSRALEGLLEGAHVEVEIVVSGPDGRKDRVVRDLVFTRVPYRTVIESDKDQYAAEEPVQVQVKIVDVEGVPARGKTITLEGATEGPLSGTTDASGVASFRFAMPPREVVTIAARAEDVAGPLGTLQLRLVPVRPMRSAVSATGIKEGAAVPIEVAVAESYEPVEPNVHGDVTDASGALVDSFLLPIARRDGGTVASGSFTAPTWGTMLLTLFCAAKPKGEEARGVLTEGQQITVQPDKALKVALGGLPPVAAPGQTVRVEVGVTRPEGTPADASVGAAVVDAAVLSLLDPLETAPGDRFYDPQLKVLSTTGSKILTWPVASRNWGSQQMDIALPPFGYRPGGSFGDRRYRMSAKPMSKAMKSPGPASPEAAAPPPPQGYGTIELGARAEEDRSDARPPPAITVRTNFPETALWAPHLRAAQGHASFEVALPDAITRQAFVAVASDRAGGVGHVRREVTVRQDVFVRSDFPSFLVAGDEVTAGVTVRNLGAAPVTATVRLASSELDWVGPASAAVKVPHDGSASVGFRVRARAPGEARYEVIAEGPGFSDTERRTVAVRPRGEPTVVEVRGVLRRGSPVTADVDLGVPGSVRLSVAFPAALALIQAVEAVLDRPWSFAELPGGGAVATAHLARFLDQQGRLAPALRERLRDRMAADLLFLCATQREDGAFAYVRTRTPSVYATARAIEAFAALRAADLPVADDRIARAARFVLGRLGPSGRYDPSEVAFWTGTGDAAATALTAEIFRILAEAGPRAIPVEHQPALAKLAARHLEVIGTEVQDPLALANAALGVRAYFVASASDGADRALAPRTKDQLAKVAKRLLRLRHESHWEPGWFHAWGGTIEATAAAMELLADVDAEAHAAALRESSLYLLSTRSSLGAWHNMAGTAAVLRALAKLPALGREVASTVRIRVDGAEHAAVTIDPADPYPAALKLASMDLTPGLAGGRHRLEIIYNGTLEVPAVIEIRRWTAEPAAPGGVTVSRAVPGTVGLGRAAEVGLTLRARAPERLLVIEEPVPSNAAVDATSLDALREAGRIGAWRIDNGVLRIALDEVRRETTLVYRLVGARRGVTTFEGTRVRPAWDPRAVRGAGRAGTFTVE